MADNTLPPTSQDPTTGQALPRPDAGQSGGLNPNDTDLAANIIRQKLTSIYADEPSASQELQEAEAADKPRSKHQKFMHELAISGKNMAEIQTLWHTYYVSLPDSDKYQVWQEFYESNNAQTSSYHRYIASQQQGKAAEPAAVETANESSVIVAQHQPDTTPQTSQPRSVSAIKQHLLGQVSQSSKLKAKHHLQSLVFGVAMGFLVVVIFLFSFFNQIIITPFIQPSRHVSSLPLIVDASSVAANSTPEVIIPKINVEIPVDYSLTSDDENTIENALENGVVHYPSTVRPGQKGNTAFFGHSSNNIFNPGKYKFAFVLLHTLVKGDTFYLTYKGKIYVYEVIARKIVPPSDVAVLNDSLGKVATATLITCDPPGTSINRLVVTGEQISPSPSGNTTPSTPVQTASPLPANLAGNGPSLWSRFWSWL